MESPDKDYKTNNKAAEEEKPDITSWTADQDAMIISMKTENKSWNQIAIVLGVGKDEVRERFKELQKGEVELSIGVDEEKKEKEVQVEGGADDHEKNSGWTSEQDEKIKSMKSENKSWKEIALEVGVSKKDVQTRFQELEKFGGSSNEENNNGGSGGGSGGDSGGMDIGGIDFGGLFTDDAWNVNSGGSGWNDREKEGGGGKEGQKNDGGADEKEKDQSKNKELSKQRNADDCLKFGENNNEQRGQGKLKADDIWSKHDLEVLEMLESKYRDHKWLHMQADFYNWTGRMVAAELIEQKFRDDNAV